MGTSFFGTMYRLIRSHPTTLDIYAKKLVETGYLWLDPKREDGTFDYKNAQWKIDGLRHLILPALTLSTIMLALFIRLVRGAMLDVLAQPFVTAAHAKGLAPDLVLRRHVFRNALIPVLTLLGLSLPALFSGVVFVEAVFAWPGVGGLLVQAVQARDYPVIMAATAVSAMLVVAGNVLADALAAVADPRVRSDLAGRPA